MNGQIKLLLPATDISVVLEALIFSELNCNNVVRLVSGKYHNTHKKKTIILHVQDMTTQNIQYIKLLYLNNYKTNGGKEDKLTHTFNSLQQRDIKNHSGGNKVRSVTIQL